MCVYLCFNDRNDQCYPRLMTSITKILKALKLLLLMFFQGHDEPWHEDLIRQMKTDTEMSKFSICDLLYSWLHIHGSSRRHNSQSGHLNHVTKPHKGRVAADAAVRIYGRGKWRKSTRRGRGGWKLISHVQHWATCVSPG